MKYLYNLNTKNSEVFSPKIQEKINEIRSAISLLSNIESIVDKYGVDNTIMNSIDPNHELIDVGIFNSYESINDVIVVKTKISKMLSSYKNARDRLIVKSGTSYAELHDTIRLIEKEFKLYRLHGVSDKLISDAENKLNRSFAGDYKEYLAHYGAISFGSTELSGLVGSSNVITMTLAEIKHNDTFPIDSIVLENVGINHMLILQKDSGQVYEWTAPSGKVGKTYPNLTQYLKYLININSK